MKVKKYFFTFFIGLSGIVYSQQVSLNQLDSAGKKDGKWVVYLDNIWKEVKDSSSAQYYRYTYYVHGENMYPMGTCGGKGWKLESPVDSIHQNDRIKLLDGEYKWYDGKGRISSIHSLRKGEYIFCKEFYSSGKLQQHFDYTMKWKDQPYTWHITIYDKKNNVKQYYFRDGKSGRMIYFYIPEKK